jgi:hypothetical protein
VDALDEWTDWRAVHDLSLRYATGVDRRDWTLYRSCFSEAVRLDFSSFTHRPASAEPVPVDDWVAMVRSLIPGFTSTQHLIGNQVITFDDGGGGSAQTGRYTAYLQAQHWMDRDRWYLIGGWYENEVERVDGEWRISSCALHQTWDAGDRGLLAEAARRVREHTAD